MTLPTIPPDLCCTDRAARVLASQDIFSSGQVVEAVVRPRSPGDVAAVVRSCAASGTAILPRGGGASYTRGYLTEHGPAVSLDLSALDAIESIDETDMTVVVQAGCTWKALHERLIPLGLRTPFWGTLSGARATVGGTISQNGAFWGSARHGISADAVLGLEIVCGSGDTLCTGALARGDRPAFFRHYGPDLTGIFTGDCGAFGVKTRIALRLMPVPPAARELSFAFASSGQLLAVLAAVARSGLAATAFGFDPFLANLRARRASLAEDFRALRGILGSAASLRAGLKQAASTALGGRSFLGGASFTLHAIVEERQEAAAEAAAHLLRRTAAAHEGREIEATIPRVMRATPFPPLNGILGPNGERWVPVHCLIAHSRAVEALDAIVGAIESHEAPMAQHQITTGMLFSIADAGTTLIEPMLLWPDELSDVHRTIVEDRVLARAKPAPDAPAARETIASIRSEIVSRVRLLGAAHLQIGRIYPFTADLPPAALDLMRSLRARLDPRGIMNPGVLGL